ncbi:MAG: HAD-IA family hydrolase, partial [Fuerstiella sp.]|nr:HAD-IA family hydrolase [Fuerstiella sp.]
PREYMEDMLGRFQLLEGFSVTLTAEDVEHGKPHPEIYLTAAKRLGVVPARMLVLEDSEAGTRAAAAAGAMAVCVPNEHTSRSDFSMASLRVTSLSAPKLTGLLRQ